MGLRLLRRLGITVAVLGVLFVALNVVGERVAEGRLASAVASRFDLEQEPSVDLRGFPIVLSILRGELPGITVRADDLTVDDLTVAELVVDLDGVSVEGGLLGGGDLAVAIDRGSVAITVAQADINRYLKKQGEDVRVRLSPERVHVLADRSILGVQREIDATGRLMISKRRLVFEPERVLVNGQEPNGPTRAAAEEEASFSVELPELPGGFRATEVAPGDRVVTFEAVLDGKSISLRGGE